MGGSSSTSKESGGLTGVVPGGGGGGRGSTGRGRTHAGSSPQARRSPPRPAKLAGGKSALAAAIIKQLAADSDDLEFVRVDFTETDATDADAADLARALAGNTRVRGLKCDGCFGDAWCMRLATAVWKNPRLKHRVVVDDKRVNAWWAVKGLEAGSTQEELDLAGTGATDAHCAALAAALRAGNTTLLTLDLSGNALTDVGVHALRDALADASVGSPLYWLDVGGNPGVSGAAQGELDALVRPRVVPRIAADRDFDLSDADLSRLGMGAAAADALGRALATNATLLKLDLYLNPLGDVGAELLAAGLKDNARLLILSLWRTSIGDAGAGALASALETNATLTDLTLAGNAIGPAGAASLAEGLKANTGALAVLNLANNRPGVGDDGAAALAGALGGDGDGDGRGGDGLTELWLSGNGIADAGTAALGDALEGCSLVELWLTGNAIGDVGATALAHGLERNATLEKVHMMGNKAIGADATEELRGIARGREDLEIYFR